MAVARLLVSPTSPKLMSWAAVLPPMASWSLPPTIVAETVLPGSVAWSCAWSALDRLSITSWSVAVVGSPTATWTVVPSTVRAMLPAVIGAARLALASVNEVFTEPVTAAPMAAVDPALVAVASRSTETWYVATAALVDAVAVTIELLVDVALLLAPALVTVKALILEIRSSIAVPTVV